jgi:hypothetical protein
MESNADASLFRTWLSSIFNNLQGLRGLPKYLEVRDERAETTGVFSVKISKKERRKEICSEKRRNMTQVPPPTKWKGY